MSKTARKPTTKTFEPEANHPEAEAPLAHGPEACSARAAEASATPGTVVHDDEGPLDEHFGHGSARDLDPSDP